MADSGTRVASWTMNDGGAVASLCADGQTGKTLALHLKKLSLQKTAIGGVLVPITSESKRAQDVARPITEACLRELGEAWAIGTELPIAKQHVPADCVEAALQAIKKVMAANPHRRIVLLAVGGSSTVGLAKAVKHLGPSHDAGLHIACVTTTFAGSECTNILGYKKDGKKIVLRSPAVRPEVRVYDSSLFVSLPFSLAVASTFNAFAHAVGCLSSTANVSPLDLLKAEEACSTLVRGLQTCVRMGKSATGGLPREAIADLIYGSILCGSVLNECSMGIHHKLAHVVAGSLGLEHSSVHTALLPFTIHFNRDHKPSMIAALSRCGLPSDTDPAGAIWDLQRKLGAPISLRKCGFKLDKLESVVASAYQGSKSYKNARPVDISGLTDLIHAAHHGRRPSASNHLDLAPVAKATGPHAPHPVSIQGTPLDRAKIAIVCVHGRFASAERIIQMLAENLGTQHDAALLAPQANGSSWYQGSFLLPRGENEPGFTGAMAVIDGCVRHAAAAVGAENVLLFGFSQVKGGG